MKIKIHSSELNRMMKTIIQCIDQRGSSRMSNVQIIYDNNLLTIRGTNGSLSAVMCAPLLGGNGESFCVDGTLFAKVCSMCNGEITIESDEKSCTIKGAGRTRLPIVNVDIPVYEHVNGSDVIVRADDFTTAFNSVAYAISQDQGRISLTGVLTETDGSTMTMVALDGFQMSMESIPCEGKKIRAIVPGTFMKLVAQSTSSGERVQIVTDGKRLEARTDGMTLNCGLLTGEFPSSERILPKEFSTESMVSVSEVMGVLKSGSAVNGKQNLIKLEVGEESIKAMNNSEEADYEADIACKTQGTGLKIAFNMKYLMNAVSSVGSENAVMKFNSSVSPCVIQAKGGSGIRLLLPVRVQG